MQRLDFIWEAQRSRGDLKDPTGSSKIPWGPQRSHVVLKDLMGTSKIPWSPQRSHWILKDPMGSSSKIYKTRCTKGISIVLGDWHMLVYLKQIFSVGFNGSLCICPAQDTTPLHLLSRIIGCHFCVSAFSIYAFCQNAVASLMFFLDTKIIIHNWNVHVCLFFWRHWFCWEDLYTVFSLQMTTSTISSQPS